LGGRQDGGDLFPEVMEQVLGKATQVTCLSTDLTERCSAGKRMA
jgi:hypothetical protein